MIELEKATLIRRKFRQKSLLSTSSPQYSESFLSRAETESFNRDWSKQSNDRLDSSSSNVTIEYRQRNQFSHLLSLDFLQSSASFVYPNIRKILSGYLTDENKSIYIFPNTVLVNKNIPLVFLGSEYFLRKSIDFERLNFPLSTSEHLEPLIDLFFNRPQFLREIPELTNLSNYRSLPQSISGFIFFDSSFHSSARHICSEFNSKENQNKFTIKDLLHLSQRENNIIQTNALNDQRFHAFKDQLTETYSSSNIETTPPTRLSRRNTLPAIVTSISS